MGKKPKNEEDAKLPRLRATAAEAQAQLKQLLEKGIEVKGLKTRSPEELEAARGKKQEWTTVTTDWLKQLFEDESVAEDFNTWVGRVLPEYADFAMFVENFQDEMHQRLLKLHSIFQRVTDTPQVGAQYAQAAEEANAAPESGQATYPHRITKPSKKAEAAAQKAGTQPAKVAKVAELAAVLNDGKLLSTQSPAPIPPRATAAAATETPAAAPTAATAPVQKAGPTAQVPAVSMAAVPVAAPAAAAAPGAALGRGVVVVHGRGDSADAVARFVERLGLKVDVLEESGADGEGKGAAERLQEQPDVSFAILLLDPGAVGAGPRAPGDAAAADATPAVKEDVIFELGCCVGKLGTKRVCVMYEGGVHAFTDKRGVQYVPIDPAEGWQLQLAKRMRHAGIAVDLNRAA